MWKIFESLIYGQLHALIEGLAYSGNRTNVLPKRPVAWPPDHRSLTVARAYCPIYGSIPQILLYSYKGWLCALFTVGLSYFIYSSKFCKKIQFFLDFFEFLKCQFFIDFKSYFVETRTVPHLCQPRSKATPA
jgi:hypothetical protein